MNSIIKLKNHNIFKIYNDDDKYDKNYNNDNNDDIITIKDLYYYVKSTLKWGMVNIYLLNILEELCLLPLTNQNSRYTKKLIILYHKYNLINDYNKLYNICRYNKHKKLIKRLSSNIITKNEDIIYKRVVIYNNNDNDNDNNNYNNIFNIKDMIIIQILTFLITILFIICL